MAIRYTEKPKSNAVVQDPKNPTSKREYSFWGSSDKNEILLAINAAMPAFDTIIDATSGAVIPLFPQKVDCDPFSQDQWDVKVHYGGSSDTVDVSFSLGVQSVKIYESIAQVVAYDLVDGGTNTGIVDAESTTIGVNGNEVEGCEIEVGKVEICVTRKRKTGELDVGYVTLLADLTDRTAVNDALFTINWLGQVFNFARGTLRIRGTPLKWNGTGELEIAYHFAFARPIVAADNFRIGNGDAMTKEGWHHGEVRYRKTTLNGVMTTTPIAYIVHQVYPYADFGVLQL